MVLPLDWLFLDDRSTVSEEPLIGWMAIRLGLAFPGSPQIIHFHHCDTKLLSNEADHGTTATHTHSSHAG